MFAFREEWGVAAVLPARGEKADNFTRSDKTCRGRNEGKTAGGASAALLVELVPVKIRMERRGSFLGTDHLQRGDTTLPKLCAHYAGKGIARGLKDVSHDKAGGIELVSRTHTADQRDVCRVCTHGKLDFCGNGIDRVHDVVEGGKIKGVRIFGQEKFVTDSDLAIGIDVADAIAGNVGLIPSDRAVEGNELTIQIGFGDRVVINEGDVTDACSSQCFDGVASDAADPKDRHVRRIESVYTVISEQIRSALVLLF